ncbi:MAG: DUF4956 domain-containing protein [Clostridiales bacterium]|nr:DUF4956 domain-containing protein [Clostridiales bacterium]
MLNTLFASVISNAITPYSFLLCTAASLVLGAVIAAASIYKSKTSASFTITLALMPAVVQMVIMLVNGNIGAGIAVMGAFNLVRFRSVPGTAKEICSIFMAMAVGLATGMGQIAIAAIFTVIILAVNLLYMTMSFGENKKTLKELKITIPENLDYTGIFDDIFAEYTAQSELIKVRTTNMGSLYQLFYHVMLKDQALEKKMLDSIRCRNGNLDIICGRVPENSREAL